MEQPKSGFKTSEFLVIVIGAVLAVLVGAGVISPEESQQVADATAQVIEAITNLVTVLAPILGASVYAWSRTKVKTNGK